MATKEERQRALKAFKKRLRVMRRDDEASHSRSPLSGGRKSGIVGIELPTGFDVAVWEELVEMGRLRRVPGNARLFELVPQEPPKRV